MMKTVQNLEHVTSLDSVNFADKRVYGVEMLDPDTKKFRRAFIIPRSYLVDDVHVVSAKGFHYGNFFGFTGKLKSVITSMIARGNKVYQFDNEQELFFWLANNGLPYE